MLLGVVALAIVGFSASFAFAGQASTGQLLYYPCTNCHPVFNGGAGRKLPNGFTGHKIVLEGHDVLGKGDAACLVCHDSPTRNPGKLISVDGTLVDVTGDVSLVCYRCHSSKYKEFRAGTHGKHRATCVAAGCHDPHTPRYIFVAALPPFVGTGFQVQILPERRAFAALPAPAPAPATETPVWFLAFVGVGLVVAGGLVGTLIRGGPKR